MDVEQKKEKESTPEQSSVEQRLGALETKVELALDSIEQMVDSIKQLALMVNSMNKRLGVRFNQSDQWQEEVARLFDVQAAETKELASRIDGISKRVDDIDPCHILAVAEAACASASQQSINN